MDSPSVDGGPPSRPETSGSKRSSSSATPGNSGGSKKKPRINNKEDGDHPSPATESGEVKVKATRGSR